MRRRTLRDLTAAVAIAAASLMVSTVSGVVSAANANASAEHRSSNGVASVTIAPAVPPRNVKITLTEYDYYTVGGETTMVNTAIHAFEAKYPNVTIKREEVPYPGITKLVDLEAAGEAPNIVIEDPGSGLTEYYAGMVPLTEFFTPSFLAKYTPGSRLSASLGGVLYGLPVLGGDDTALIYNKTDFAKAGITSPPATWAQLLADAKLLTVPSLHQYGFGVSAIQDEESTWQLEPFVFTAGGTLGNPDSTAWSSAMQLWLAMVKDGYMPVSVTSWHQTDEETHFLANNVAMEINGPWDVPALLAQNTVKWGVAPIPVQKVGQSLAIPFAGESWSIGKASSVLEAASAAFIEFLTNDTSVNETASHDGGYLPLQGSLIKSYGAKYPPYAVFSAELLNSRARVYGSKGAYTQLSSDAQVMIDEVLTQKETIPVALATLAKQVKALPT